MSAVAIATPGMTLLFSCRVLPIAPAIPPHRAMMTSQAVGAVRASISGDGVVMGVSEKYTAAVSKAKTT